jgi:NAD(P)-dependent dehydrogenase (short-subunit alcohol dehydrogenase family)
LGQIDNKVCIVTGASRGIGKSIAQLFAAEGGRVACVARTLHEGDHPLEGSLDRTAEEIGRSGGEAFSIAANLTDREDCVRLVEEARSHYGPVDILVNNAALTWYEPIKEYRINRWRRNFEVNLDAPFYLSQLVLPDMIERKDGAIINITSGAAIGPGPGPYPESGAGLLNGTVYGTTKAALNRFTQGLASEVYKDGVRVAAVGPSQLVVTPGSAFHGYSGSDMDQEPAEYMARAALLLASEPIDRVTGRVTYSQRLLQEFGYLESAQGPEERAAQD